jgi:ABC-2 type transport system permease protein
VAFAARLSWRDFLAVYPPRVYVSTLLPRAVLQVTFLAFLGYYARGEAGRQFAFIGACAQIIVLATVVRGPDVVIDERVMGTLHRVRLGVIPLPILIAARWGVYVCAGLIDAFVAIVVAGLLVGELSLAPKLLSAAPLFVLVAISTSFLGLVVAAISLTQRVDVLFTNLAAYLLLVFAGVVAPISTFGDVGEHLVRLLPLTNGLMAIRAFVANDAWVGDAVLELGVAAAWAGLGLLLIQLQERRARRAGTEELL